MHQTTCVTRKVAGPIPATGAALEGLCLRQWRADVPGGSLRLHPAPPPERARWQGPWERHAHGTVLVGRSPVPVELELTAWSATHAELLVRPAWSKRRPLPPSRVERYFDVAHEVVDRLSVEIERQSRRRRRAS